MENKESFRYAEPQYLAFAGITGYQLNNWYRNRKFCGRCGHKMRHDEKERMMRCDHCGNMEFPKICPAVIIGVTDGDKILMSKYAGRAYKKYGLLAGFTEIGETIEETVQREVMEEVGLKVKNIRYYKSQPWSFSDTILTAHSHTRNRSPLSYRRRRGDSFSSMGQSSFLFLMNTLRNTLMSIMNRNSTRPMENRAC